MLPPRRGVGLAVSGIGALLAGVAVEGLTVGSDHTCVLLDDGSVKVSPPRREIDAAPANTRVPGIYLVYSNSSEWVVIS